MENEDMVTPTNEEETDTSTETEEVVTEEEEETPKDNEDVERLRKENETLRKDNETLLNQKDHWKKKANGGDKDKDKKKETSSNSLTTEDVLAINNAGLTEIEDVDFARRYAAFEGVSLAQALKDPVVQTKLSSMKEARTVAGATDKSGSPSTAPLSGDQVLEQVRGGKAFGADSIEGKALFEKKFGKRK
jgi:hypothetical protein